MRWSGLLSRRYSAIGPLSFKDSQLLSNTVLPTPQLDGVKGEGEGAIMETRHQHQLNHHRMTLCSNLQKTVEPMPQGGHDVLPRLPTSVQKEPWRVRETTPQQQASSVLCHAPAPSLAPPSWLHHHDTQGVLGDVLSDSFTSETIAQLRRAKKSAPRC